MARQKAAVQEVINNHYNADGEFIGASLDVSATSVNYEVEPDYVKLYLRTIGDFKDMPSTAMRVFYELVKRMDYADKEQLVYLNPTLRQRIMDDCHVKRAAYDKAMRILREKGLIKRVANNTFAINPDYVGRGAWRDISVLRAKFDFITGDVIADMQYTDANAPID